MPAFSCCFWWFILGFILGWLLNWLLSRMCCKKQVVHTHTPHSTPANTLVSPATPATVVTPEPVVVPITKTYTFDLAAAKAAGFDIKKADDLTVVEGIGPKINELLNIDGITTFAQLSETPVAAIQHILDKAGPRFALAKPGTWPQQALLAAENRWVELKTLQDNLKGGV